ncbi:hypothetical protein [Paramagnetospirillum magneticum]|uniref:Uncharacterized protein n=1 Tax=Paramagnetospirillum magneticum (strain ATCC 700264 / AMB-1) TaxID=342108 RepID=Q2VZW7_PARM1|nr:hypothetical protein [Paramagnetospirillum magneticum]BAE52858.1 hypothetical protein amb4054 [Paramagnetospirillum magneticum AMB-1]
MSNPETVIAGKTVLHRSAFGTVSFTDTTGNRVTMDSPTANKLFEAIRDGSGEKVEAVHREGTEKPTNLFVGGKRNVYAEDSRTAANW